MKFYIYNKEKGARDVTAKIGNDYYFSLGCDGAFGALHMFPSRSEELISEEARADMSSSSKKSKFFDGIAKIG